jgi:hypothetical protein
MRLFRQRITARESPRGNALASRRRGRGSKGRRGFELLEPRLVLAAHPLITEIMANNGSALLDGDGADSDWIEVHNPTAATVDLAGWHLTDSATNLDKWTFPSAPQSVLSPGEY